MLGKFALMLCPVPKCPKIGTTPDSKCPTHDKPMVRTIVMTDAYVKSKNLVTSTLEDAMRSVTGKRS